MAGRKWVVDPARGGRYDRGMNTVAHLERQILELHGSLGLRTTLERAAKLGELLARVKESLPHGEFGAWMHRLPFTPRAGQMYIQIFAHAGNAKFVSDLSLTQFLRTIRRATKPRLKPAPEAVAGVTDDARVYRADCRKFCWGDHGQADVLACDPPWSRPEVYEWIPRFAAEHLRDGGLVFCLCGVVDLPARMETLTRPGILRYWHTLAMVYDDMRSMKPMNGLSPAWRPVILLTKGEREKPRGAVTSDVYTVRSHHSVGRVKQLHPWQQPLQPFVHWYSRLAPKGSTFFVPWVGSGTEMIAALRAGHRAVGTEIDPATFRIARKRIRDEAAPQPET